MTSNAFSTIREEPPVLTSLLCGLGAGDAGAEHCTFVRSASSTEQGTVQIPAHRTSMWERFENPTLGSITTCRLGCCGGSPAPMVVSDGGAGIWRTPWYALVRPIRSFVNAI